MPKVSNDDVVNYVISRDKNMRKTIDLLKKQMKHYDIERERMDREFGERQAMHLQFIEDDKKHHAERVVNHDKKKEGLAVIVMNLENEIAEEIDFDETNGTVEILPQLPAPEIRRPRRKPSLMERAGLKRAKA